MQIKYTNTLSRKRKVCNRIGRYVFSCIALIFALLNNIAAQVGTSRKAVNDTNLRPLQIGDTIPESIWNMPLQVTNHPDGKETITLADYRDKKLIILDFWAVWCASCVESLGKIQNKLNYDRSKIAFIPVTLNADTVVAKFQRSNKVAGEWQFPLVVGDKVLKQLFQHSSISHFVWITHDGVVKAFTSSEYITDGQLLKGLQGDFADVTMKIDRIDFDSKQPLLIPDQVTMKARYSGFRGFIAGVTPTSGTQTLGFQALKRSYIINTTLRSLCLNAMSATNGVQLSRKKIIYDVNDEEEYFNKSNINTDIWNQQFGVCYEATLPENTTSSVFRVILRENLQRHFHIKLTIEEKPISVIVLSPGVLKPTISPDESIDLKSLVYTLNLKDNGIPYVICPVGMEAVNVSRHLKECTSTRQFIEMMGKHGVKSEERKEVHQVLVIKEIRKNEEEFTTNM